jgi:hypothetical protein
MTEEATVAVELPGEAGQSIPSPMPPLRPAGNDAHSIGVAVSYADTWNAWIDQSDAELAHRETADCVTQVDAALQEAGRSSDSLARSLLLLPGAIDPWSSDSAIPRIVEEYGALGFTEFIFSPPRAEQMRDFLRIGIGVLSKLRD